MGDKGHFQIKLVKIGGRTIRARVLITETRGNLEILVKARHHNQLFELLRGLGQSVELSRMQAARHQKIARAFGGRGSDDRGLIFAKSLVPHAAAHGGHHIRAQGHVLLQLFAAQIEIAVLQTGLFGVFLIAKDHQGQLGCRAQDFDLADKNLDLTGGQFGVHKLRVAGFDLTINANAPF